MRKNTRRVLAFVMAFALILGNFVGLGTTAEAAGIPDITSVTAAQESVPGEGGEVEVKVVGENLSELYYEIRQQNEDKTTTELVGATALSGVTETGGDFLIPVPANNSAETRKLQIRITYQKGSYDRQTVKLTQEAFNGGNPSVDKTKLKEAIANAQKLNESEYTEESWQQLQVALQEALAVEKDSAVTDVQVQEATEVLNQAINGLKPKDDQEANYIQAKVLDEKQQPVAQVAFELIETSASNDKIADLVSDDKGEVRYSTEKLIEGGQYALKAPMNDTYFFQPNSGYHFNIQDGKVSNIKVNGSAYSEEVMIFTAKKIGGETDPEEPEKEAKSIDIRVVDESGVPLSDSACKFAIVDKDFPNAEHVKKAPLNGTITADFSSAGVTQTGAIIRLASSSKDQYEVISTPQQYELVLEKGVIKSVNGEAYAETRTYLFQVKKKSGAESDEAKIQEATITPDEFKAEGGTATLRVEGEKLNDKLSVKVKLGGKDTTIQPVKDSASTDIVHLYTVTFPENTEKQDQYYSVQCVVGANVLNNRYLPVMVAGKETGGGDGKDEVRITKITATPERLEAGGGSVKLNVEGENLTADNWTAKAVGVLEGTEIERGTVEASGVTSDGATLTFGKNTISTNRIQWTIQAGPVIDGEIQPQQELVIYQDANIKVEQVDITDASQPNGQTIVVTFEKDVKVADLNAEELGKLIHLDRVLEIDGETAENSDYYLQEGDRVSAEGNTVTIQLDHNLKLTSGASSVYFEQGALKTMGDVTVKKVKWIVTSKPSIYSIDYEKNVFDYHGGTAVAVLTGVRLQEIDLNNPEQFKAVITNPQTMEKYDFPITVKNGEQPTVTFPVPKNETDRTQSYLLSLELNKSPVYESTGSNKAKRAIVSVLPKGIDDGMPTLGGMTITGNNKVEGGSLTDIEVMVSQHEGELKVELKLAGTNLDSTKTEVRAIDENGVIWPISHVPE